MLKYVITLYNLAYILIENRFDHVHARKMANPYSDQNTIIESDI